MFDNIRGDLAAHRGDWGAQGFWVMVVYRFGRWRYELRPVFLRNSHNHRLLMRRPLP